MRYGPCTFWLIGCIAVLAAASPSGAFYLRFTPKLESSDYWDHFEIALVEVSAVPNDKEVTLKVLESFNGDHWGTSLVIAPTDYWFDSPWGEIETKPPAFKVGQHLLLAKPLKQGVAAGIVIEGPIEKSSLIKSCRTIKQIRAETDIAHALQLAVASSDSMAEKYILKQLQAAPEPEQVAGLPHHTNASLQLKAVQTAEVSKQLEDLRADAKADMAVRLAASGALNAIRKTKGVESDDWQWAAGVLQGADAKTALDDLRLVAKRLTAYPAMREKTVDLLAKLADDLTRPDAVRAAAMDSFGSGGMFDAKDPEGPTSKKVISVLLSHLQDKSARVREFSADSLYQYVADELLGDDLTKPQLKVARRVSQALVEAIEREKDDVVRNQMVWCRDRVEDTIKGSPIKSQP